MSDRIYRAEDDGDGYVHVPNEAIDDPRLDPHTLGLLIILLRVPAGQRVSVDELTDRWGDITGALARLERAGYLVDGVVRRGGVA